MIPFLDLKAAYQEIQDELDTAVLHACRSGWYIGGPEVEAFEHAFSQFTGASHCVGVGNGLDALILALRALDIGEGDEVIVPSHTFIATWLAVSAVGAIPIPVEPSSEQFVISAEDIQPYISSRTKAILPVHLYGCPVDILSICALAKSHGLYVVEDAAQAHGARVQQKSIGAHGDIVCWSFYPGKNLGALGDGGAVTTSNEKLALRMRLLSNYGSSVKYHNEEKGLNSRLDPVQAAVLRTKLRYLDQWNQRRQSIAALYRQALADTPLQLPEVQPDVISVWHLYVVRTSERDALQHALLQDGIQTLIHYPIPPHMQQAYSDMGFAPEDLPVAKRYAEQVLSLPMGPHLSISDAEQVIDAIKRYFAKRQ